MTTKLRHPHVAPLRAINSRSHFFARTSTITKRKSAVQILQETKAFYVKSETVLDKKQEFRPGKVSVSESSYGHFSQGERTQKIIQKENRLQDKLRLLLDFDSTDASDAKRNPGEINIGGNIETNLCFQHKSLPDLLLSPGRSSSESSDSSFDLKCDGDSRSAYSSRTQPETRTFALEKCYDCRRCMRSTNDFVTSEFQSHPRIYSSFRATKSGEFTDSKMVEVQSHRRRSSNTSSCNRSRHNSSSKHSQSADSGRQSQGGSIGLRTGRSGLPEFSSPPPTSIWTDSGTEDDSPPLFRNDGHEAEKKRPILRSKSDISYKYCASKPKLLSSSPVIHSLATTEKLETFFDHLGMDPVDYKELASKNSRNSSPVFFSSVSSIDSCVDLTGWSAPEPCKNTECPSIVERNARIIKWLYNCRKFQKTVTSGEGKAQIKFYRKRLTLIECKTGAQNPKTWEDMFRIRSFSEYLESFTLNIQPFLHSVRPIAGKFYARHDAPDKNVLDDTSSIEQAILKHKMALAKDKYKEPQTGNMEYGWYVEQTPLRSQFNFHYPKQSSWITQIGALIAIEDQKNPKKPFTGVAFKV